MIENATSDTFRPHVGDTFGIAPHAGEPFEARLTSCTEASSGSPDEWRARFGRVPFSLLFHAAPDRRIDQGICSFSHGELGEFELFIVPLGPDEHGMRYEAVIS